MPYAFKIKPQIHFAGLTPELLRPFASSAIFWGAGAGIAVSLFMSSVPLFQKDVLDKIPVVREYFIDNTPESDKPF
ncbi:uncharacterized protein CcaverHIS019_0209900 [Cutaneotrichosporon cavernicola]|uniref:Uncharacterized protein n=1 Tax=Cutaneotrichosporon cavernicola TaxID=279322 RepID=A0AA48IIP0_9TREE|nr:uncharacterized protein CcaverHIS019_0209900 [Cutaneotrichosporon cavernicola]BEI89628.1 hypothetical protein CcaverHIS019_0209900 [Cutaneotrichosporon cavernicola]BEI97399.1 hypothetical protein CcaverHIS631_0209880 [Cutaneotrichosporon cavernicola]BEJ05177.1 hypothetical protein CcaverHIS641_0209940 [Cutaneotrichosporon cavernicola]